MAQTFILAYPNLVTESVSFSGGSWLATAPASNVGTRALADTARSTDASTPFTKIIIDHGSAKSARALAICRHNLSSAATITWKRGTTSGASDVADSGAIAAWRFTPYAYDGALYDAQILMSAATSARYELIEISDATNTDNYVEIGRVFIGPVFESTYNPSYGLRDKHEDLSTIAIADGGADWITERRRSRAVSFALNWLSLSEGDTVHEMEQILGTTGEVLYLPYTDTPARMQRYGMLGRMRELSGIEYPQSLTRGKGFEIVQRI